jgi:K+-sensing histidine kinase KdpD
MATPARSRSFLPDWLPPVVLTWAIVVIQFLASRIWPTLLDVSSIVLIAVVYAAFRGGAVAGTLSAVAAMLYLLYAFSPSEFFQYSRADVDRLVCIGLILPAAIVFIHRQRRLQRELAEARRELERHARELEERVRDRTRELASSLQALKDVSSGIAHDLRNPVRYVLGYSELLLQAPARTDPEAVDWAARIHANAARAERLIDGLVRYTNLQEHPVRLRAVDLEELLGLLLARYDRDIIRLRATLKRESRLPIVWADATLAEEALAEVLSVALQGRADAAPPVLTFRASRAGPDIRLFVESSGFPLPSQFVGRSMQLMGGSAGIEPAPPSGSILWLQFQAPQELPNQATAL